MRKIFVIILTLCCFAAVYADEINAISATQSSKTDWFSFGDQNSILVTINDAGDPVFPNKNYNMANGNLMTAFSTAPTDEWVTLRTGVAPDDWNTICMERNITASNGATFWNVVGETDTEFTLEQVAEPQAGHGYIIYYTDNEVKVKYGNEIAINPMKATAEHPIQGFYDAIEDYDPDIVSALIGNYIIYLNLLYLVTEWIWMADHCAYVVAGLAPEQAPAPSGAPRVTISKSGEIIDSLDGMTENRNDRKVIKILKDCQLFIRKGGKTYNAQGQIIQ